MSLRVHTHVREDVIALFGFLTEIEEVLFQRLISVAGVGPALGLKVLSGLEPADLVDAIRRGDLRVLGTIPGVGKKTAERLVVELKDKMPELLTRLGEPAKGEPSESSPETALRDDLLSALLNLGYQRSQVEKAVRETLKGLDQPVFRGRAEGRASPSFELGFDSTRERRQELHRSFASVDDSTGGLRQTPQRPPDRGRPSPSQSGLDFSGSSGDLRGGVCDGMVYLGNPGFVAVVDDGSRRDVCRVGHRS